jgi:hypothetical protein
VPAVTKPEIIEALREAIQVLAYSGRLTVAGQQALDDYRGQLADLLEEGDDDE